ncbi:frataxin, partial [Sarcoptes scabiei]
CLGCSANAVAHLNRIDSPSNQNQLFVLPIAWSLALTVSLYLCAGVSGGHLNPAITLGMATVGKIGWTKIFHYMIAQYLGAFFGSAITFLIYRESLIKGNRNETFGVFSTLRRDDITLGTALIDQIISIALFVMIICAILDERNMSVPKGMIPIAIGFANLGAMQFSFSYNCGGPLNPARDFAPRIFALLSGWSEIAFTQGKFYYWVPIVACHIGGVIGCWLYRLIIENHWPIDSMHPSDRDEYGQESIHCNANNIYSRQIRVTQA